MQTITTIGLDIAKSVFQVHGIDAEAKVISEPSTHGPFRHLARCSAMSEVEVIAEVTGARSK